MGNGTAFVGKKVGQHLYVHCSALPSLGPHHRKTIQKAISLAGVEAEKDFNVVKLHDNNQDVSFLYYPAFFEDAFPSLAHYWSLTGDTERLIFRTFQESLNPPVLHRKELLLAPDHPRRAGFASLTVQAEAVGLFDDTSRIGFAREWAVVLIERGYRIQGHDLLPIGNEEFGEAAPSTQADTDIIQRHLTALSRTNLSAPMQTLARLGYLNGQKTIFDYGCGRGSDVRFLTDNGITASGWDPYYAPDNNKNTADVVNLGFVINVIEDRQQRDEALKGAFELAQEWLVVSAMLVHSNTGNGIPYADGVLTSRNTFQKYYSQVELAQYLEAVLGIEPVPVAPGIFYVFKSSDAEQRFSSQRVAKRRSPVRPIYTPLTLEEKTARVAQRAKHKYESHAQLLETLWALWLGLGREPKPKELGILDEIRTQLGSLPLALRLIIQLKGEEGVAELEHARQTRIDDLSVYFAKLRFAGKRPRRPLEPTLKEDIKHFFGDIENALAHGEALLLRAFDKEAINAACNSAAESGLGWLIEGHSLQLHTSLVSHLPSVLRTYVHCATSLYGDVTSADLVKIHIRSSKLTLMEFDDFDGKPLPRMIERVKINLMNQRLDFFDYGETYIPPFLYLKSRYINESCHNYGQQLAFDEELENLRFLDLDGYGPSPEELVKTLAKHRYQVDGFTLARSQSIPNLDDPCGENFTYRDFIHCGDTQQRTNLDNLPKEPNTYTALLDLAVNLLDPIIDYFGMIKLTYGFCSQALAKEIPRGIAPRLDQHASYEKNRKGNYICDRKGAAVDFIIEDEDMLEVTQWIVNNLNFDRLYLYDRSRPVHISYSNSNQGRVESFLDLSPGGGKAPPRGYSKDTFLRHFSCKG
ncbi:DNA phosphorothioation-associated putative methyltransferase [Pseudomonas sp. Z8(2022)]|uniref:DNA phosphorothioation-associated putative methyltransferase n=1 Tax=Pseudomonas sp. Z8(2022) TaxID=2962597 RepID=UPI0021F421E4|nr:DNA phosphorothioation-associated putative methyltransferase [Pseudomonas sp. Z8(2022)]UYP32243.1 DNA phosphorothioation-associated putative methyltransferase [Pseudomonas sp. Z8(2022)]